MAYSATMQLPETIQDCLPIQKTVKDLLLQHRAQWNAISENTGLSLSTISKIAYGHIPNPGINSIDKLLSWFCKSQRHAA